MSDGLSTFWVVLASLALGLVPAVVISLHILYLAWHRGAIATGDGSPDTANPSPSRERKETGSGTRKQLPHREWERPRQKQVQKRQAEEFSLRMLLPRYGIPAFLLFLESVRKLGFP